MYDPLGTIQILLNLWTGWVGSEISHFCLITVQREWVGSSGQARKSSKTCLRNMYLNGSL